MLDPERFTLARLASNLRDQKKVMVTAKGLRIASGIDTFAVEQALLEYFEWLY